MIRYACCYCGREPEATPADIATARATFMREIGAEPVDDAEAFLYYGRDVCPSCQPGHDRVTCAEIIGGLRLFVTKRGNPI